MHAHWQRRSAPRGRRPGFTLVELLVVVAIMAIMAGTYIDLINAFAGTGYADGAYSFGFGGQVGYLDHALASPSLLPEVSGTAVWHINGDEPSGLDYNDFNQPALFNPDQFRASDHDPVVVGLCESAPPIVDVSVTPDELWPPNHKYVDVSATVDVIEPSGTSTVGFSDS